jgi:hypothetical protein
MRRLAALALLVALVAAAPATAQGPAVLATVADATPVSARGGIVAFSVRDPATGRFALTVAEGGTRRALPVAQRGVPFDVDLGPDRRGRPVALYSRCRTEPRTSDDAVPVYTQGRGCDLFRFSFASGRETRLGGVSTRGASEVLPSQWRGRIAYVRRVGDRRPELRVGTRAVPGGPRRLAEVLGLDLAGRRLVYAWQFDGGGEVPSELVRVVTLGRGVRTILRVGGGGLSATYVTAPVIEDGAVFAGLDCIGDVDGCTGRRRRALRFDLATGRLAVAVLGEDRLVALARDRRATIVVRDLADGEVGPFAIARLGGLPFAPARPR